MNNKLLTISLGQFDVCWGDPEHNLGRVRGLIQEAAARNSDVLVLPELWDTGFDLAHNLEMGTRIGEGRFAEVAALAQQHQIHIVGSMLEMGYPQGTSRPCYNTAVWFGADGATPGSYRKIHLFRPLEEDQHLLPGGQPQWLDLPWGRSALAICYDLRFPELFRSYRAAGVEILFLPAQWPKPRLAHWQTLLRARAIENQMVVVACNRVGSSGPYEHFGHSAIINAWGETIIEGGDTDELLTAAVDLGHVAEIREQWPVFEDRRPDFYECA